MPNEGNLPAALTHLHNALTELFEPHTHNTDSPYTQLTQAIPGSQGGGHHVPGSSPPLNLDAVDLKTEIDTALKLWKLDTQRWRPQDTKTIDHITENIRQWCKRIDALLNPQSTKTFSGGVACPACQHTHVYRINASGEKVRKPALEIIAAQGCTCLACHHTWTPDLYPHLCRVLGFDTPTWVLE